MEKYQISPGQIPHLVRLTADLFHTVNQEIAYSPNKDEKATQIHFVVDLLKELANTAYPLEIETRESILAKEHISNASLESSLNYSVEGRKPKISEPTKLIITEDDVDKSLYNAYLGLTKIYGLPNHAILKFEEWKTVVNKKEGKIVGN